MKPARKLQHSFRLVIIFTLALGGLAMVLAFSALPAALAEANAQEPPMNLGSWG